MNEKLIDSLIEKIPELTDGQLHWVERVVSVFALPGKYVSNASDLFTREMLFNFGDAMRVHHSFSVEPFSKDKFEYVFVQVLNMSGHDAKLAPKGNPGHDATLDTVRLSLKTQADSNIKNDVIWISKFMELGKGTWGDNPKDLEDLMFQFFAHMKNYDRILSLRCLHKAPSWKYELVEIPKTLLAKAAQGRLQMMMDSKQHPKPGYCRVTENNAPLFELYFDGGSERKLQIKNLHKRYCTVHAVWEFTIA